MHFYQRKGSPFGEKPSFLLKILGRVPATLGLNPNQLPDEDGKTEMRSSRFPSPSSCATTRFTICSRGFRTTSNPSISSAIQDLLKNVRSHEHDQAA